MMKSLKAQHSILADRHEQLAILQRNNEFSLVPFQQKLEEANLFPLKPEQSKFSRSTLVRCATRFAGIAM